MKYLVRKDGEEQILEADEMCAKDGLILLYNNTNRIYGSTWHESNLVASIPDSYLVVNKSRVGMTSYEFDDALMYIGWLVNYLEHPMSCDDTRVPFSEVLPKIEDFLERFR